MSAFWTFAVVLTVAYIIYYSVIICKDLAKPRERASSSEETFALVDAMRGEPSKVVEMTDRGFQVDDGSGNIQEQEITNVPDPKKPEADDSDPGPKLDGTGAPVTPAGKKILSAQEDMDLIDPKAADEESHDTLKAIMCGEQEKVNFERTVTPSEKSSGDENAKKGNDAGQRI